MMSIDTLKVISEQLKAFPHKIKCVNFAWWGEPLTNPNLAHMVEILNCSGVTDCVSITTNAALLSKSLSDDLIKAGLGRLRISLQGLDSETYERVGGVRIDFDELVENIRYFHEKGKMDFS